MKSPAPTPKPYQFSPVCGAFGWSFSQTPAETRAAKPLVKWAGGKGQLLAQLRPFYPTTYDQYFEPFFGGGAVFFDLKPGRAVLNDVNRALMGFYSTIQNEPAPVIVILRRLHDEYSQSSDRRRSTMFYRLRSEYNTLDHGLPDKAAYLIFLNKTCYNGMYRENSSGEFNVPFGRYKNPKILDELNLRNVSALLRGATLSSGPFDEAVRKAKAHDFVYFDPPYHPLSNTSSFTSYHAQDFSEADQVKLRDVFRELHSRGCFVMLSNSYTDFIRELYRDFHQHTVMASRAINCKANGRGKIKELLITNYKE